MARPKKQKEPQTTIFFSEADQEWHAFPVVGVKPDGRPDRRHRHSKHRERVVEKVLELEDLRAAGTVPKAGRAPDFGEWLDEWLTSIAPMTAGYNTLQIYESKIRLYLKPTLGHWPLQSLTGKQFTDLYRALEAEGLAAKTVDLAHTTARLALSWAIKYKYLTSNPVEDAAAPVVAALQPEPLNAKEVHQILDVVRLRRNHVRWWVAFLGLRQGEALGLRWSDIDWETGITKVRSNAQRRKYQHGCDDPVACAKAHCKTKPCGRWEHGCTDPLACAKRHCERPTYPSDITRGIRQAKCESGCTKHGRGCPERQRICTVHKYCSPVCEPGCTGHARHCPDKVGGLVTVEPEVVVSVASERKRRTGRRRTNRALRTKSPAGTRRVGMPPLVLTELAIHKERQEAERFTAGSKWQDNDFVFANQFGQQINPRSDWGEWETILKEAGVEHIELHGARHSGATFLLDQNVDPLVAMAVMGWSSPTMAKRYQYVGDSLLVDAAARLGEIAFPASSATQSATHPKNRAKRK